MTDILEELELAVRVIECEQEREGEWDGVKEEREAVEHDEEHLLREVGVPDV